MNREAGGSRTPTYIIKVQPVSLTNRMTPMEWKSMYGRPSPRSIELYVRKYNESLEPGGANEHLGRSAAIYGGMIVSQLTGEVVARWEDKGIERQYLHAGMKREASMRELAAAKVEYKGYTIEKSGFNYYVKDPSGYRAFGETPATIETAKKWIDMDINEKRGRHAGMNREAAAIELLRIARDFLSMDFPTQEALDKYLKDHPDADRSNHHVKETKAPAKKQESKKPSGSGFGPHKNGKPVKSLDDVGVDDVLVTHSK